MVAGRMPSVLAGLFFLAAGCASAGPPGTAASAPMGPAFQITGGTTTGPLRVDRVELTFANGLGETTVPRNDKVTARAVVRFSGNGNFRAEWQVDGRVLETVNLLVTYGSTLTLTVGSVAPLPTFEPGPHELALRILHPPPAFPLPAIRYFVTLEGKPAR